MVAVVVVLVSHTSKASKARPTSQPARQANQPGKPTNHETTNKKMTAEITSAKKELGIENWDSSTAIKELHAIENKTLSKNEKKMISSAKKVLGIGQWDKSKYAMEKKTLSKNEKAIKKRKINKQEKYDIQKVTTKLKTKKHSTSSALFFFQGTSTPSFIDWSICIADIAEPGDSLDKS